MIVQWRPLPLLGILMTSGDENQAFEKFKQQKLPPLTPLHKEHDDVKQEVAGRCYDYQDKLIFTLVSLADQECQSLWKNLSLGYTDSQGHPLLRKEIASMYPEVSDPQVLVIAPQEGIYLAMKSIVQLLIEKHGPDDIHAVVTFPAYQSLYGVLNMHTEVSYWKAEYKEDSGWQFDLKQLAKLIQPKTRFLVVNFPHNPTAFVPSLSQWQEIIDLCREKQLILFCDEMYRLSDNDGSDPLPSAVSMYENAVTLSGLSKTFGLPGLRIGWLCTRDAALMEKMAEYKDYLTICSSAPSEILSIMALRNKQKLIDRTVRVIRGNLDVLSDFFHEYEEYFEWHRPSACTTMFARLKPKALALGGGSAAGLCERLVNEAELLLVPGSIFEFEDKFVRIGFGRRNMPEAVEVLRSFMKQQTR